MDNIDHLVEVLFSYAPDEAAKYKCTQMIKAAQDDGHPSNTLVLILASSIADGLRYGNWPWVMIGRRS